MNEQLNAQSCPVLDQLYEVYVNFLDAAEITGFTTRWLAYRRVKNLPPQATFIGNQWFYKKADLDAFKKNIKNK